MEELSAAIDRFSTAAERLERVAERAAKRMASLRDGAAAQGAIITQLRAALKEAQAPWAREEAAAAVSAPARAAAR